MEELLNAYGWQKIESKNKYMYSYLHDESKQRMNIYFTTMTVTIQDQTTKDGIYCKIRVFKDVKDIEKVIHTLILA